MAAREFGPYRVTPETKRRPSSPPWPPTYTVEPRVHECLRAVERDDEQLRGRHIDTRQARKLAERALARNAWGTASIEGNPMTLAEVESLLARQATPDSIDLPSEREIINTAAFLEHLEAWRVPRTPRDVLKLHKTLMKGVLPDAGEFKRVLNFIGRRSDMVVVYVATPPARVERELAAALLWARDAPEHPLVKAFVVFHEFQAIHPFRDGNGRVGRALLATMLNEWGYPGVRLATMDAAFNEDREGYYSALAAAEATWDRTPWLRYVAGIARDAFRKAAQLSRIGTELPTGLNERQAALVEWFAQRDGNLPVKFADVHAAFPAHAERTLKRDLAALRAAHVIVMKGERKASAYQWTF
jgi:Fic family protein